MEDNMPMFGFPCRADIVKIYKTTKRTVKGLAGENINKAVIAAMHNPKVLEIRIIKRN